MTQIAKYVTQYKDVRSVNTRSLLRFCALSGLAVMYKITNKMSSGLQRNRVQFLSLHHVFENEEKSFRKLLRVLSEQHHFTSYSQAVHKILTGNIDRPYVVLSFDDGLRACLRAAQIMGEFGIKGCFFLIGSMVGEKRYQKTKAFCAERLHLPPVEFMSWDEVETLLKEGHEVGCHTMTHPDLTKLSVEQLEAEIQQSYDLLREKVGNIRHFAWPYGKFSRVTRTAVELVFQTGFESCASTHRGCHVTQCEKLDLCIRRDHTIAKWPTNHTLYFLAKNSQMASVRKNGWPQEWEIASAKTGC